MSSVFIIINEWVDQQDNEGSEVTGAKYFTSEDQAWDALDEIAVAYGRDITHEELSFSVTGDGHIKYEEYYVQELTNGDN